MAFFWMLILQYHIQNTNTQKRFVRSLEFLKKSWSLPSNFPDLENVWKIETKFGKMVKSLDFFFQSYNKCFIRVFLRFGQILFNLVHTIAFYREKSLFLRFLRSVLFDKLESGKRNYCFGKKVSKKSRILDPKICTNPVHSKYGEQVVLLVTG